MILQDISEYSEQLMLTSFIGAYLDFSVHLGQRT